MGEEKHLTFWFSDSFIKTKKMHTSEYNDSSSVGQFHSEETNEVSMDSGLSLYCAIIVNTYSVGNTETPYQIR